MLLQVFMSLGKWFRPDEEEEEEEKPEAGEAAAAATAEEKRASEKEPCRLLNKSQGPDLLHPRLSDYPALYQHLY